MLPIDILTQPDDTTCGPTCLHALYRYHGNALTLNDVITSVSVLSGGGTLAVLLACDALRRGYRTTLYTYNLQVFDPSWFSDERIDITQKLTEQLQYKNNEKLTEATHAYCTFLALGGRLRFRDLDARLLNRYFKKKVPIIAGLNATYLYRCKRDYAGPDGKIHSDDVRGFPAGHFVVLCGYDEETKQVIVADPYGKNPLTKDNYYPVTVTTLINAIMLGIVTYDSNLLIIEQK